VIVVAHGACSWAASLVVLRPSPCEAPVQQIAWGLWIGVFGRNPCRLARHRRGAARGWHHSFLEGVVAGLRPLALVCRLKP
jgi:hypothetical protein